MDYHFSLTRLQRIFDKYDLAAALREKQQFDVVVQALPQKGAIRVVFPGYKTDLAKGIYDYRVDLKHDDQWVALSHANIIVDIYHKCQQQPSIVSAMRQMLYNAVLDDARPPLRGTTLMKDYRATTSPEAVVLAQAEAAHQRLNKTFPKAGNAWDLSFPELLGAMKWIALQEDVNYPHGQGRRMPFARYLEAIYCAEHQLGVGDVITRALQHRIPAPWPGVDYARIGLQ